MLTAKTGESLQRAIVDDPRADRPRLIYGDYLLDTGQADRGEYVHIAVRLASGELMEHAERVELITRKNALFQQHGREWERADLRGMPASRVRYERGLLTGVYANARHWKARGDAVLEWEPVDTVGMTSGNEQQRDLQQFLTTYGRQLRRFSVDDVSELTYDETLTIATCEELRELEALQLRACQLDDDDVVEITTSPHLRHGLRELDLSNNLLGNRTAALVCELRGLTHLSLAENFVDNDVFRRMRRRLRRLLVLDMNGNADVDAGVASRFGRTRKEPCAVLV